MAERKAALVTGAGSGIGAAIATRFAREGYRVSVFDLNASAAVQIASGLADAVALEGDVSNEQHAIDAVEKTFAAFGRLDVLVNNAGIEVNGSVAGLTAAQWDRQIAVNLRGVFLFSKYALAKMRAGASILNISSVHGMLSWPECAAYDTTKTALIGLTRSMALDHGAQGVRVNAICPGYIDTPLLGQWLARVPDPEAAMQAVIGKHAVGRIGRPEDIAEAAVFLASEHASFITGTHLMVDGGLTARGH